MRGLRSTPPHLSGGYLSIYLYIYLSISIYVFLSSTFSIITDIVVVVVAAALVAFVVVVAHFFVADVIDVKPRSY